MACELEDVKTSLFLNVDNVMSHCSITEIVHEMFAGSVVYTGGHYVSVYK